MTRPNSLSRCEEYSLPQIVQHPTHPPTPPCLSGTDPPPPESGSRLYDQTDHIGVVEGKGKTLNPVLGSPLPSSTPHTRGSEGGDGPTRVKPSVSTRTVSAKGESSKRVRPGLHPGPKERVSGSYCHVGSDSSPRPSESRRSPSLPPPTHRHTNTHSHTHHRTRTHTHTNKSSCTPTHL